MRSFILRLAGFAGAPIISALAPFIILPVISRFVGDSGWANVNSGQAIGLLAMVGVLFGWSVIGPVRVARASDAHERAVILSESLRSRAWTALLVVPLAGVVTYVVCSPDYRTESVMIAVAMAVGGFTPAWFCIGEGNPRALMLFDGVPKLAASALALPFLLLTGQVFWYPLLLVALTVPAFAIHARLVSTGHDPAGVPARPTRRVLASLVPTAAIDAAGNVYGSTGIPIATVGLSASAASSFASTDRVYRIGLLAVIAVGNAFQAWVLDPRAVNRARRHLIAFAALGGLGAVGGTAIAILGPWATGLVFGAAVAAAPLPCALFGTAFFFISCGTPLIRNLLIPAGRFRLVFAATICSALVGVTTMLIGAAHGSADGVALGVAVAEAVSVAILAFPAWRQFRRETAVTS
ncbi:polysaccharide biosynthesis protein [Microbacterium sp. BG28]|uniref:polysaccharide biosynthesis protein n=1 Tax=Microbacterium sp. BG28 TaxID=3097356 RepID=UPI002A5AEC91|nr:polysaccharide biosynthesis protein [Microbacterium sp. BG28]MDY0830362.1 polysaccharide biosynthesis protein [Microbacterium sp. BG28]